MSRVLLRNAVSAVWFIAKTPKINQQWQVVEITVSVDTFLSLIRLSPPMSSDGTKISFHALPGLNTCFSSILLHFHIRGERERERDKKWIAYKSCTFVIESTCHFQWGGPLFSKAQSSFSDTSMLWNAHSIGLQFFLKCAFLWIAELKFFATRIAWEIMTN